MPGLFLDRDGVVIEDAHYLGDPTSVALLPGAPELIVEANRSHLPVAAVTNQSAIARSYYGWDEFATVNEEMICQLAKQSAVIDVEFTSGFDAAMAERVKPGPRMLTALVARLNLAPGASWLIGDKAVDIRAARRAGLKGAVHVLTGHGKTFHDEAMGEATESFRVIADDDPAAARVVFAELARCG